MQSRPPIDGRGAAGNPRNRFERLHHEPDPGLDGAEAGDEERPLPRTAFLRDTSRSIIAHNDSPDVGFSASINPYRGCEHGCVYCYARPTHEYLGLGAGLDFESKILVKDDAPRLLRAELASPKWKPQVLALSGVTDCYQPIERRLRLTRQCIEVLLDFRNPLAVVTKNRLVTRDADLLAELAGFDAAFVFVSITSLRPDLQRVMEPRTSSPERRLEAIAALAQARVPVGVIVAPVIPGLNDHEVPAIVARAAAAGATRAAYVLLRLPLAVAGIFQDWLGHHFPDRRDKVLNRIRELRGGRLNDPRFGSRMRGEGIFADQIAALFRVAVEQAGINKRQVKLSTAHFRRPGLRQATLFDYL